MEFKKNDKAYLNENNTKVTEVIILRRDGDKYLVKLPSGGGIRVSGRRLYGSFEEAEDSLPYRNKEEKEAEAVKPAHDRMTLKDEVVSHSPHYYGWI